MRSTNQVASEWVSASVLFPLSPNGGILFVVSFCRFAQKTFRPFCGIRCCHCCGDEGEDVVVDDDDDAFLASLLHATSTPAASIATTTTIQSNNQTEWCYLYETHSLHLAQLSTPSIFLGASNTLTWFFLCLCCCCYLPFCLIYWFSCFIWCDKKQTNKKWNFFHCAFVCVSKPASVCVCVFPICNQFANVWK